MSKFSGTMMLSLIISYFAGGAYGLYKLQQLISFYSSKNIKDLNEREVESFK
jgi:hypothetical protein